MPNPLEVIVDVSALSEEQRTASARAMQLHINKILEMHPPGAAAVARIKPGVAQSGYIGWYQLRYFNRDNFLLESLVIRRKRIEAAVVKRQYPHTIAWDYGKEEQSG